MFVRKRKIGKIVVIACLFQGYCQPRAYIATQAPIPDTFDDFWRMIWEQESATVVMLTREEEAGKVWVGLGLGYGINQPVGLKNGQSFFVYSFNLVWTLLTYALPHVLYKDSGHLSAS